MLFKIIKSTILVFILLIFHFSNIIFSAEIIQDNYEVFAQKQFLKEQMANKNIGDSIFFGKYEQNGIIHDGKEYVEWIILKIDDNYDSAILISKFILDCYPFNGFSENVTWENSSLRNHMNSAMLSEMFNESELACILPTFLLNSPNIFNGAYSGGPTYDYIFIPGIDEMIAFFSNDNFINEARLNELKRPSKKRMCYATNYAISKGVRVVGENKENSGAGNYFLRTTGLPGRRRWFGNVYANYFQAFVSENGSIVPEGTGINSVDDGIRPMVQISY